MTFDEIRKFPTSVTEIPIGSSGVHESCLRSWHILEKVREMLSDSATSRSMMLDLIKMMKTDLPIVIKATDVKFSMKEIA